MREDLQDLFKRTDLTTSQIAAELDCSKATISLILNGKYNGREALKARVRQILKAAAPEAEAERPAVLSSGFSGITPGQRRGLTLLQLLRKKRKFGLLVGPSGVGKSYLCHQFRNEYPDTSLITVRRGQSLSGMLTAVGRVWGVPTSGTNDQRMERLLTQAEGRFLVVDEADNLSRGKSASQVLRLVEVFRYLYDAGAGVALVGLPSIYDDICKAGETYVFSRIRYINSVEPPNRDILSRFWNGLVSVDDTQNHEAIVGNAVTSGFFRYLEELADAVREFDGDLEAALGVAFRPGMKL